jgi:hypothetical protein
MSERTYITIIDKMKNILNNNSVLGMAQVYNLIILYFNQFISLFSIVNVPFYLDSVKCHASAQFYLVIILYITYK